MAISEEWRIDQCSFARVGRNKSWTGVVMSECGRRRNAKNDYNNSFKEF